MTEDTTPESGVEIDARDVGTDDRTVDSGDEAGDAAADPAPSQSAGGGRPDPAAFAVAPDCSRAELLAVARVYARAVVAHHDLDVTVSDLDWSVSTRAKRRAGVVKHRDGDPEAVVLTWAQFQNRGWTATASTVRHELIHVHRLNLAEDPSHGEAFRRLADRLDTDVHCDRFVAPAWWVDCQDCEARLARYRRSKLVKQPDRYRCGSCGGRLTVTRNED